MTHHIDTNDLVYLEQRYGKITQWNPGAIDIKTGKINPHVTQVILDDSTIVSVIHVKPVYYETYNGLWRPLSEVTVHHGNHTIEFTSDWWKVHPRYMAWLDKRMKLIGGQLLIPSVSSIPTPYSGVIRSIHESLVPLKIGLTTSTFYPDPDVETTTVDGRVERSGVNETWSTIRGGAGNGHTDTATATDACWMYMTSTSNQFGTLERAIYLFDTSAIPDTDTVSSATLSIYGTGKDDPTGLSPSLNITASNPASNTDLVNSDYQNVSDTTFATAIGYSSYATTGYNNFTLNASGISAIAKTGVSKFAMRNVFDISNTSPTWSSNKWWGFSGAYADQTGTSSDPKLVVEHSGATVTFIPRVSIFM